MGIHLTTYGRPGRNFIQLAGAEGQYHVTILAGRLAGKFGDSQRLFTKITTRW